MWAYLRGSKLGEVNFRRQHAIGPYVVDFCSPAQKLVIEVDGSQHIAQADRDAERTVFLKSKGYRVLRFWNDAVMNDIEGVVQTILAALRA